MEEEEKEETITVSEIIQKDKQITEEAQHQKSQNPGNEESCTYDEGYITQPVFGCRTCQQETKSQFGMCFGCSMNCHLYHEVFELFDKRGFRCDCGTPRSGCQCSLMQQKEEDNTSNKYNHNFDHLYCWCNSTYKEDQVMYQCLLCMDWFHLDCIQKKESSKIPGPEDPCEFICGDCYQTHNFLKYYYNQFKLNAENNQPAVSPGNDTSGCFLEKLKLSQSFPTDVHNTFWVSGWRASLCSCQHCTKTYEQEAVSFLLTEPDQVEPDQTENDDENDNVVDNPNQLDILQLGQDAVLRLPIPQQQKLDLIYGYNSLVSNLKTYIRDLAESGKQEVTKRVLSRDVHCNLPPQDIDEFFETFRDAKKQKKQ